MPFKKKTPSGSAQTTDEGQIGPLKLDARIEQWPLSSPFHMAGFTWEVLDVLLVTLETEGRVGRGEAAGVYYRGDTLNLMLHQIEILRARIESSISRAAVPSLLPAGGARNALDCALWDLEAKITGRPAWATAGLERPKPLLTTFTCGAETPEDMAVRAISYREARAIKVKLTGDPSDADRVRAVRSARPDVWLGVDANQGFTRRTLEGLLPVLIEAQVKLIEQPLPVDEEAQLDGLNSPIPIAADESVQTLADIPGLVPRYQVVNIKLDKCGGLTHALAMARAARSLGLKVMVGNMLGTSLAMAPAFLVGQLCQVVDLDGPIFLRCDRKPPVDYSKGLISCPEALWGYPRLPASPPGESN
jgi:L-Ala-D/L-Glu epimerase